MIAFHIVVVETRKLSIQETLLSTNKKRFVTDDKTIRDESPPSFLHSVFSQLRTNS